MEVHGDVLGRVRERQLERSGNPNHPHTARRANNSWPKKEIKIRLTSLPLFLRRCAGQVVVLIILHVPAPSF